MRLLRMNEGRYAGLCLSSVLCGGTLLLLPDTKLRRRVIPRLPESTQRPAEDGREKRAVNHAWIDLRFIGKPCAMP
jgi:hypothetical protein